MLLKLKSYLIIFTMLISLSSCQEQNIDEEIYQYIVKNCNFHKSEGYIINLSTILDIDFDRTIIIDKNSDLKVIKKMLKINNTSNLEFEKSSYDFIDDREKYKMILLKKGKVIKVIDFIKIKVAFQSDKTLKKLYKEKYNTFYIITTNKMEVYKWDYIDPNTNKYKHVQE